MAEYTIPKPYRDFYVTNPYIELKESNERLQRIVKSGYVATDSFDGTCNQVLTFDKEKHGFSLTNDSGKASTWSMDLYNKTYWESGSINSDTGAEISDTKIIRTIFIPVFPGSTYTINATFTDQYNFYRIGYIQEYDENKNHLSVSQKTWETLPITYTPPSGVYFIRFLVYNGSDTTVDNFFSTMTAYSISITSYTAPSDVTVKVAENVAGIPTTADGWEQGVLSASTGRPASDSNYVRSRDYVPVTQEHTYRFFFYHQSLANLYVYQYGEGNTFITRRALNKNGVSSIKMNENTKKIRFMGMLGTGSTTTTVDSYLSNISYVMTTEPMIVTENDTRIVTMPPFTSLYIESNVPYHGHALDLAE